ncbi:wings apart-like protein homolog [Latimeria chalumnae]|uniref:Wings apart-like protein homolog n=1 Tax=Latimeria chalumnae TaxID=7897 RepID=H3AN11_LATCH|nr:PREDICTED: wings apart-like protein homolog [Latimeria chalumnae]|eukprot:XP_005992237.1 PREDICTED: wings apart-like protein homolog [Latimeria chalumnae]
MREYETSVTMTSRFGKTYSRKASDGNSKFDEVFSNKRATLSTKWGETTFKAQLGQKRPNLKPELPDIPKKAKVEEESSEDPFGFDSDEESLPVSSRNVSQSKSSAQQPVESLKSAQSENFISVFEANSRISQPISGDVIVSSKFTSFDSALHGLKEKSSNQAFESGANKAVTAGLSSTDKKACSLISEGTEKNSYSNYKNAADGDKKPNSQSTSYSGYKTETKDTFDTWDTLSTKRSQSPLEISQNKTSQRTTLYGRGTPIQGPGRIEESLLDFDDSDEVDKNSKLGGLSDKGDSETLKETVVEDVSQTVLRSTNCRTYCRSNKTKQSQGSANFDRIIDGTGQSTAKTNNIATNAGPKADGKAASCTGTSVRGIGGRTRDYTVLHPSCVSVCNVTIQDTMERTMDEYTAGAPADLGEAGRLRKKTDPISTKTTNRHRSTNTKSKKAAKLEFFGFEDKEEMEGEGVSANSGSSNYKIKYFGFDDLSESDEDDDDDAVSEKKARKKRERAAASMFSHLASSDSREGYSPNSQTSTNADVLEFTDDFPVMPEVPKKPVNIQPEKAKENTRKIFSGPKRSPTKAVYNARHWNQPEPEELPIPLLSRSQTAPTSLPCKEKSSNKDDGVFKAPAPPPKVIKTVTIPTQPYQDMVTSLKCRKEDKELYTVVQHVKHFNDVVEFGENQEFTDDIEYLLSGLKSTQPLNTRCLSVISLATKCAMPSFRMHLRAHGMVAMVFKTLGDAQHYQNLALCTAALMYILSRDRLNMDLDRASLDLMIRLLELEQDPSAQQLTEKEMNKVKEKIRKLCETVHNKHLDLENITTGHLAMETLLSLTSKRAGDWFKEELRLLGGLDHIVDKVKECVDHLDRDEDEENLVASLWGAERCLRVLESVTVHNPENQSYLIAYKDSQLIVSSARALRHCEKLIKQYNRADDSVCVPDGKSLPHHNVFSHVGKAVEDCMRAIIGVLLNLTNDNEWGSTKTGEQDDLIITALNCVLQVPQHLPQEQRFDIRVLGLGLLINLVEYSARNRHCLVNMETVSSYDSLCAGEDDSLKVEGQLGAVEALVQLFLQRERAAQLAESQTDDFIKDAPTPQQDQSGEWQETSGEIQWVSTEQTNDTNEKEKKEEEEEELDLNKALQHAGKHMEDCIVASYTALLLGCLCQESPLNVTTVRESLPDGDFSIMTEMLKKFLSFMNLTCAVGTTGQKSISRVIEYLEHC